MMELNLEEFAGEAVEEALKAGADEADVFIQSGRESEVSTRMLETENIKESRAQGYGIRVFRKKKLGFCFSSDFTESGLKDAAKKAVSLAGIASEDEFNGLPDDGDGIEDIDLDLLDTEVEGISTDRKLEACRRTEQAMFDFDKRVFNSEGAGFFDGESITVFASSKSPSRSFKSSYYYLVCRPVARENDRLQAGWWFSHKRHFSDLDEPEIVGRISAERTVRMLGARVPMTTRVPVVFDNVTGISILSALMGAVDGDSVYKKASYLVDRLGHTIASPLVTVVDDPLLARGLGSSPFDGEGLPTSRRELISEGMLRSYIYDTYTARKAGAKSTSNAQRSYDSLPSIGSFNVFLEKGKHSFDDIIGSVENGLYLTNLMGFGANPVTGDYSLGASGIWIEKGKLAYPVEGITVASNMIDMLKDIDMVGDDLMFLSPISSPTFRVREMTVSGG
jgi:PmbA protein